VTPIRYLSEVNPELAEQIATQEPLFALLITEPDGVRHERDELAGVPIEWTAPSDGVNGPAK
jgi:hypothetical protein